LLYDCRLALKSVAEVLEIGVDPLTGAPKQPKDTHLLLVPLLVPVAEGVAFFARCRRAIPRAPLILMGSDMEVDFVVEFLKCGADDYVSLPLDYAIFRRKVQRALGKNIGSALDIPALEALGTVEWAHRGVNLRHSYRVKIESTEPVRVALPLDREIEILLWLVDLSVPIDNWPGGMLLSLGEDFVEELPFEHWDEERPLPLSVILTDGEPPVVVDAYPISTLRRLQGNRVKFNVKYKVRQSADLTRLVRFWSELQRRRIERSALRAALPKRPSHPLVGELEAGRRPAGPTPLPPASGVSRISSWLPQPLPSVEDTQRDSSPVTRESAHPHEEPFPRVETSPEDAALVVQRDSRAPEWIPPPPDEEKNELEATASPPPSEPPPSSEKEVEKTTREQPPADKQPRKPRQKKRQRKKKKKKRRKRS